jgi:hypothetical protein
LLISLSSNVNNNKYIYIYILLSIYAQVGEASPLLLLLQLATLRVLSTLANLACTSPVEWW